MDELAPFSCLFELIAVSIGTLRYRQIKESILQYFLYFLWYVTLNDYFGVISWDIFGIPNYIPYNIYFGINFTFFLWWYRRLVDSRGKKRVLLAFQMVFIVFFFIEAIFLVDFVYRNMTNTYALGTVFLTLAIAMYFADMLKQDAILNVTESPYFWISFGILLYCLAFLPFEITYVLIEREYASIRDIVIFTINIIQYGCFAYAFLIAKNKKSPSWGGNE